MRKNVLLIILGLIAAYFMALAGDGIYLYFQKSEMTETQTLFRVALGILTCIFFLIGAFAWVVFFCTLQSELRDESEFIFSAVVSVILLSFVFGTLTGPLSNFGPWPFHWFSRWSFLPVLGIAPSIVALQQTLFPSK